MKLQDVCSIKHGFAFKGKYITHEASGYELVTPGNFSLAGGFQHAKKPKYYTGPIPEEYVLEPDDLIVTMTDLSRNADTLGLSALIPNDGNKYLHNQRIGLLTCDQKQISKHYLHWLLRTREYQRTIAGMASGSTVKHTSPSSILSYEATIPDLQTQKRIAVLLDLFDAKIEANTKLNGYLEELADGMFRRHFGGLTDNATLADFANVTMGQSPAGSSYNEAGIGTIFYQGRAEFGWRYPTQRLSTTEPKRMAKAGDVLMSVRAPVGDLNLAYEDCCIGRGLAAIHCDYPSYGLYLMRSLHKKLYAYNGEGTIFGSINGKALNGLPIALPNNAAIRAFEKEATPIDTQIRNNEVESRALVTLRDTLLPKLMAGEIDVSKVDLTQLNSHLV